MDQGSQVDPRMGSPLLLCNPEDLRNAGPHVAIPP